MQYVVVMQYNDSEWQMKYGKFVEKKLKILYRMK